MLSVKERGSEFEERGGSNEAERGTTFRTSEHVVRQDSAHSLAASPDSQALLRNRSENLIASLRASPSKRGLRKDGMLRRPNPSASPYLTA